MRYPIVPDGAPAQSRIGHPIPVLLRSLPLLGPDCRKPVLLNVGNLPFLGPIEQT